MDEYPETGIHPSLFYAIGVGKGLTASPLPHHRWILGTFGWILGTFLTNYTYFDLDLAIIFDTADMVIPICLATSAGVMPCFSISSKVI